jgi:hypothetical protein
MLIYPQLRSGALSQFPLEKTRRSRTVTNVAADGSTIKLADPAAIETSWALTYADLSDEEAAALLEFFESAEGTLNGFTFLDPVGNLLARSDELDDAAWQRDPMLSLASGISDPAGAALAWRLSNIGAAEQSLSQTLAATGQDQYCLSAYVRADAPAGVGMKIGNQAVQRKVGTRWTRIALSCTGSPDDTSLRFAIEVPAGGTVEVYGLQVEPQAAPSVYKSSAQGGVFEGAHLADDVLAISTTDANRHSCTVKVIHANHL